MKAIAAVLLSAIAAVVALEQSTPDTTLTTKLAAAHELATSTYAADTESLQNYQRAFATYVDALSGVARTAQSSKFMTLVNDLQASLDVSFTRQLSEAEPEPDPCPVCACPPAAPAPPGEPPLPEPPMAPPDPPADPPPAPAEPPMPTRAGLFVAAGVAGLILIPMLCICACLYCGGAE